ncbi:MAG: HAD family phosphatase [Thermoplasmata archaeon]|nr:HAD family phosphatase [Thermoplasmata archaeon]
MKYDLVVFDLDGVLVEPESSWVWVHDHYSTNNEESYQAYNRGEIDDHEFMRRDIALWRRGREHVSYEEIARILDGVPIMPGAKETLAAIKGAGAKTAIVSGGLLPLAKRVAYELGIEEVYANDLEVDEKGGLRGEGILGVALRDKLSSLRSIMEEAGLSRERTAAVGNSRIDAPMLKEAGMGIAFNPADEIVKREADVIVGGGDLRAILCHLGL